MTEEYKGLTVLAVARSGGGWISFVLDQNDTVILSYRSDDSLQQCIDSAKRWIDDAEKDKDFWGNRIGDMSLRKNDWVTPANDNCSEGPHQRLWQLFHRTWTQSDGPSYDKSVWLELEKEVMSLIKENQRIIRLEKFLHETQSHPDFEYVQTDGPRKNFDEHPPEGDGWERNIDKGRNGWERFDYHEEAYWRRVKSNQTSARDEGLGLARQSTTAPRQSASPASPDAQT